MVAIMYLQVVYTVSLVLSYYERERAGVGGINYYVYTLFGLRPTYS